jgi:hypothetical protein
MVDEQPSPYVTARRGALGDRRVLLIGVLAFVVVAALYPLLAHVATQPVGVFLLPPMVTAVLGGWRPTAVVGLAAMGAATIAGLFAPFDASSLLVRLGVIAAVIVLAAVGTRIREAQFARLSDLSEAVAMREAFERALAPQPEPPPGFVAVAGYRPAAAHLEIGGDFLEAVAIADGRLAILMGDVCGHGPREAAFGAALRAGWKSIALGPAPDPAEWVRALDEVFFRDGRIDTYVTLCTGFLDLRTRTAQLVNLGHPEPIVLGPPARELAVPPAPPLGLGFASTWSATEAAWGGEPLLLYTDGLVENPRASGPPRRWGTDGLLTWLDAQASTDARELGAVLLDAATDDRELRDDAAFLIVTATPPA